MNCLISLQRSYLPIFLSLQKLLEHLDKGGAKRKDGTKESSYFYQRNPAGISEILQRWDHGTRALFYANLKNPARTARKRIIKEPRTLLRSEDPANANNVCYRRRTTRNVRIISLRIITHYIPRYTACIVYYAGSTFVEKLRDSSVSFTLSFSFFPWSVCRWWDSWGPLPCKLRQREPKPACSCARNTWRGDI